MTGIESNIDSNGEEANKFKFYKLVLTGGPCGGKTTGQIRLRTFFVSLGWKVYCAPETALTYLSGGVWLPDLNRAQCFQFQRDIIRTMMRVEESFCNLGATRDRHTLLICDRVVMNGSAYRERGD